jgi:xylan 1,4-beta-xylosidase
VTKTSDGGLAIAAWNLVDPDKHGVTVTMTLDFAHLSPNAHVTIQRVDAEHGNVLPKYAAMGQPLDPTEAQVDKLNQETALPAPETMQLTGGRLELKLTPDTLALVKVEP